MNYSPSSVADDQSLMRGERSFNALLFSDVSSSTTGKFEVPILRRRSRQANAHV